MPNQNDTGPLLRLEHLQVRFPTEDGWAFAVNDLNLEIMPGSILGLVGESGCGKSLTGLSILRLVPRPGEIATGNIWFQNQNLLTLSEEAMRKVRGAQIALIPQDPLTALNPVYTIGDQITEVIRLHQHVSKQVARKQAIELLDQVRIPNAPNRLDDYPHQFSGGMRQRVMIAMALSCKPSLLIADEPTTALDVTVQAQILDLMRDVQKDFGTAILLITHDLGVVAELCDTVAVMYAGRVVEGATVQALFKSPKHPYTQGLLNSLPPITPDGAKKRLEPIEGQPPLITHIPPGCAFEPRCKERMPRCPLELPADYPVGTAHSTRCFLYAG